jgi:hypothetical protein
MRRAWFIPGVMEVILIFSIFIEGKITRQFFYQINLSILRKLFALTILRVEFGHFYSG